MLKRYFQDIKRTKAAFKYTGSLATTSVYAFCFRELSFLITPLFLRWGLSANGTTLLSGMVGMAAVVSICVSFTRDMYGIGLCLYFAYYMLDYVDGNLARCRDEATYFGKFFDGLVNGFVESLFPLALGIYCWAQTEEAIGFAVGLCAALALCFSNFIIERYCNYSRWCQEAAAKKSIADPYGRNLAILTRISRDLQFCLLLLSFGTWRIPCILSYALVLFINEFCNGCYYLWLAWQTLRVHRRSIHAA